MPRSWQSGERDEDLHFTHTESVLCLRGVGTSSERSLAQGRGWAGATNFGWPQCALAIVNDPKEEAV